MTNKCAKCKQQTNAVDGLCCVGPCGRIFHRSCSSLSMGSLTELLECRNLCFKCDSCVDECYRPLEKKMERLEKEVSEMKSLLTAALEDKPTTEKGTPALKIQPPRKVKKTPATYAATVTGASTSKTIATGPKTPTGPRAVVKGTGPSNSKLTVASPKFWVYVSGLAPDSKESDVLEYVGDEFDADINDVKCVKLLPKNLSLEECEYISFKIGFPLELKEDAINPESWPNGVSVREFSEKKPFLRNFRRHQTPSRYNQRGFRR
jgi:hypothetical protein